MASLDPHPQTNSHFQAHAEAYEKFAGSTSSKLAAAALARLPLSSYSSEAHILDSACGPGIVTKLILSPSPSYISVPGLPINPQPRVTGIDVAPGMVAQFVAQSSIQGWETARAFTHDAKDLTCFPDAEFDAVVMNLGIFALSDPIRGAQEMHRVLKPGGHVIVTTWKHAGAQVLLQKVVDTIRPGKQQQVLPVDPEWKRKEKIVSVMEAGGFEQAGMQVWAEDAKWEARSLDEIVEFLSAPLWTGMIWKGWSEEEKGQWKEEIVKQMTEEEKSTASVSMVGWICIAKKEDGREEREL
ncbi:S-adenosyl-L-methionine-dependent methyltransferase [Xylariales sp. AK1849]|nr:S-adenosyl-L-methionine-dependent methyltransferase [Xylariales sp. AK1849]